MTSDLLLRRVRPRALGLDGYGLDVGCVAGFVLVDATTPAEAVITHPPRKAVVRAGRLVHQV